MTASKKRLLYTNIPIFLISLLIGYRLGCFVLPIGTGTGRVSETAPAEPFITLANGQRSVLAIIVDDLSARNPKLDSAWMVMYLPQNANLTFMPVYPSIAATGSKVDEQLKKSFKLQTNRSQTRVSAQFLEELESLNLWWSGYVVLDQHAMSQLLVDQSESAVIWDQPGKRKQSEETFMQMFAQLNSQQNVCRSLLVSAGQQTGHLSPTVMEMLSDHILVSFDQVQLLEELQIIEAYGRDLVCDSPAATVFSLAHH